MFMPLLLACTLDTNNCIGVAGPPLKSEDECHRSVVSEGVLFLEQNYPGYVFTDYKCIAWGTST